MNKSAPGAFKKEDSCTHATGVILSGFNTAGVEQRHVVLQLKVSNGKTTWPLLHLEGILEACPIYSIYIYIITFIIFIFQKVRQPGSAID